MSEPNWTIEYDGPSLPIIYNDTNIVALIRSDEGRSEKNAALIHAAPNLYEALAEIVDQWGSLTTAQWQRARGALSKARGEVKSSADISNYTIPELTEEEYASQPA